MYLHGLYAAPNEDRIAYIERRGNEVIAPHIVYEKYEGDEALFEGLVQMAEDFGIEAFVGSSMGAFMAFYLADELALPALLFNPALHSKNRNIIASASQKDAAFKYIVLGRNDKTIDPKLTESFLKVSKYFNLKIIKDDFGHKIPFDIFKKHAAEFFKEISKR